MALPCFERCRCASIKGEGGHHKKSTFSLAIQIVIVFRCGDFGVWNVYKCRGIGGLFDILIWNLCKKVRILRGYHLYRENKILGQMKKRCISFVIF